jgi:hypothetical protein
VEELEDGAVAPEHMVAGRHLPGVDAMMAASDKAALDSAVGTTGL